MTIANTVGFTPLSDRILVSVSRADETEGGLHIPGNASVHMATGTVVAAGPGKVIGISDLDGQPVYESIGVEPGDRVMFPMKSSLEIRLQGRSYRLVEKHYIVGVLHGDAMVTFAAEAN